MWRTTRQAIAKGEAPQHNGAKAPAMLFEVVAEEWLKRDQAKNKVIANKSAGRSKLTCYQHGAAAC